MEDGVGIKMLSICRYEHIYAGIALPGVARDDGGLRRMLLD